MLDALLAQPPATPPLREITEHASLSHDRRQLNARYLAELRQRTRTPIAELPMVFAHHLTAQHIELLGERLASLGV